MNCNEAKKISIIEFLQSHNIYPVRKYANHWYYLSPYRDDKQPSFKINLNKNQWYDLGENRGGNIIDLVILMYNTDLKGALSILQGNKPNFSFSVQHNMNAQTVIIKHLQPLQNKALIQYLDSRNIPLKIASHYLQESYYQVNDKQYFALAFKNDKGGYELRNKYFKGCTSPKYFTTIPGNLEHLNIFEGFFNFLSALVYYKTDRPLNSTIVLNSLSFVGNTLDIINQFKTINLFLDNDEAGCNAVYKYQNAHPKVNDYSKFIYPNKNDFNDYIKSL